MSSSTTGGRNNGNGGDTGEDMVAMAGQMLTKFSALSAKTAKKSWGFTKSATRTALKGAGQVGAAFVPKTAREQLGKATAATARSTQSVRELFIQKHKRDLGDVAEIVESDSEDEFAGITGIDEHGQDIDLESLFDTVLSSVDRKFFDAEYQAAREELQVVPVLRPEDEESGKKLADLKQQLSSALASRIAAQKLVQALLKKRIIAHSDVFLQGVCHISVINSDLKKIIIDCRRSRMKIGDSKANTAGRSLGLLQRKRRRANLTKVTDILATMEDVKMRHEAFNKFLKQSKFKEAIRMTQGTRIHNVHLLEGVKAAQPMLQLWDEYRKDPTFILTHVDRVIEDCLAGGATEGMGGGGGGSSGGSGAIGHRNFTVDKYLNAVEAYIALGDTSTATDKIIMSLWHYAVALFRRHLCDASIATGDPKDLKHVSGGIGVEHMIPTVCTLGAKLLDFALLFNTVLNCHSSVFKGTDGRGGGGAGSRSPEPKSHIGDDDDETPNTTTVVAGGGGVSTDLDTQAAIAFHQEVHQMLQSLGKRIVEEFHRNIKDMLQGLPIQHLTDLNQSLHVYYLAILMVEATALFGASSEDMRASRHSVKEYAMEVIGSTYHRDRGAELVRRMAEESWTVDEDIIPEMFKVVKPISPDNYRQEVKSVKNYVTKHGEGGGKELNPFFQTKMMVPMDMSEGIEIKGLDATPFRTVVTGTTGIIANRIFEYVVRVAVRFPPLASEVLTWCQELVAIYFYTTSANFVSSQRTLAFEQQSDFLPSTKEHMKQLREMSLQCLPQLAGRDRDGPLFPPAVFHGIAHSYANDKAHYATPERLTAIEAIFPLIDLLGECSTSVAPLLVASVIQQHNSFLTQLRETAEDVLRVGMFRLASACFNFERYVDEIGNFKYDTRRQDMQPSKYVYQLVDNVKSWLKSLKMEFPTSHLSEQFWIHFVLVLQRCMMRGYAKVRRLTDSIVSQMKIDAPAVVYNLRDHMPFETPKESMPGTEYCVRLLDAYFLENDQRDQWVKDHHKEYTAFEIVHFLGITPHRQKAIDNLLTYLKHEDVIPPLPSAVAAKLAERSAMSPASKQLTAADKEVAEQQENESKKKKEKKSKHKKTESQSSQQHQVPSMDQSASPPPEPTSNGNSHASRTTPSLVDKEEEEDVGESCQF